MSEEACVVPSVEINLHTVECDKGQIRTSVAVEVAGGHSHRSGVGGDRFSVAEPAISVIK